ncbi:uncharacterized protein LOC132266570 [Cornus florida]|uniref:uncharacterized protein LOC132266570 n=1 Tax=Cornus florida TaxID=4283 RepID=UPI00289873AB|nr:uncharacterized protein LOC132266570 [Cornus florida]
MVRFGVGPEPSGFPHPTMKEDYETGERKQAAADVLFHYSKFVMACIGNQVRPCDLRLHLMKEISGMPTSLKRRSSQTVAASPVAMGESSSSGQQDFDKAESYQMP